MTELDISLDIRYIC